MGDLRKTYDALEDFLAPHNRPVGYNGRPESTIKRIQCADGFSLSVQASRSHYCHPRDDAGPWFSVEVGFPSARVEELMPYIDGDGEPTENVYGYVPINTVVRIIADHGGFASFGERS